MNDPKKTKLLKLIKFSQDKQLATFEEVLDTNNELRSFIEKNNLDKQEVFDFLYQNTKGIISKIEDSKIDLSETNEKLDLISDQLKKKSEEELEYVYEIDREELRGKDGKDYILTDEDKLDIAKSIEVPVVEKVIIEKTEVIKEQPLITEVTKKEIVEVAKYEDPKQIADKLNTLDKAVDWKVLKNIPYDVTKGKTIHRGGGGVQSIVAGTNTSIDEISTGNFRINSLSDRYKTTSTTSHAIVPTGTLTFTVDANLSYISQQDVIIAYDASNHMHGQVVSYSGTTLVVDITHKTGSGTYALWDINLDGIAPTTPTLQEVTDQGATTTDTITVGGVTTPTFTEGSVQFIGAGGLFNQNNQNFFWNTNPSFNPNTLNISGTLGAEQITNGSFTGSATPWTLNAGWVYGSNAVSKTSNGVGALTQAISTMTNGLIGIVSITVSALTVGTITVSIGNATVATISANGTYTYRFVSSNTSGIVITPSNTARLTVDDVSVRYLTGGGLVVAGASFFRSKMTVAQNNTSTTLGGTSDHLELLNTTASGVTNFNFKFGQTALSGIQATSTGTLDFIATNISSGGGFTWKLGSNVASAVNAGNLDINGWSTNENGRFAKKVIAGLNTITAPATLNSNGSYAGRGVLITTTNTVLTNAYEFVYLDSSLTAGCTGTTSVVCSAQTNSSDCNLYTALGCINGFSNCIDYLDEESCNLSNPPCSWVTTAPCSEFNEDEGACTSTTGCTANYEGDCTVFGDETTCIANSGCVWDGSCTGLYYTSCSGEYDVTPYCGGGEYGSCEGTASCANVTDETICDGFSPCVWGEQQIVFLPSLTNARQNNMSLKYAIKKTGGTGNSIVKPFDTNATIEGATEKVFSTVGDSIVVHFFDKTIACSSYTNETACNAVDGCLWDTEDPENPFCGGTPTALPSWNIIADKV